ncbi:MAG: cupin domain-containing protein [Gammaproteobacteria bacterium]|nr:cupin domain-containing protein [Gammaproteobacteria bacterium]
MLIKDIFSLASTPESLAWEPFREGIDIFPLYKVSGGCSAALLRYAPGATVPLHQHSGYEHILVLSGEQADEHQHYTQGTLLISPPGTSHSIISQQGCIVLAIWEKPINFISNP